MLHAVVRMTAGSVQCSEQKEQRLTRDTVHRNTTTARARTRNLRRDVIERWQPDDGPTGEFLSWDGTPVLW
jgi:hypothetical protein